MVGVFMWKRRLKGQSGGGVSLIMKIVLALLVFGVFVLIAIMISINSTDSAFPDIYKAFSGEIDTFRLW